MSRTDKAIRALTSIVVTLLAAVAAVVSYRHALEVVIAHGEAGRVAYLVPLTVDGIMVAASMTLLDSARRGRGTHWLSWVALVVGVALTLGANILHGWAYGPIGAVTAALPAVALVIGFELLMVLIRRAAVPEAAPVAEAVPERVPEAALVPVAEAVPEPPAEPVEVVLEELLAEDVPAAADPVADVPDVVDEHDPLYPQAVRVFFSDVASGEVPPIRAIKQTLNVGQPKAVALQSYLRRLVEAT